MGREEKTRGPYASSTYEMVLDLEPSPKAANRPSSLVAQQLPPVRVHWADDLVTQKKFEDAIKQYALAISATQKAADKSAITEKIAQGYIQWATARVDAGDFWGAFDRISTAEKKSNSEAIKQQADAARTETITAFAASQGAQARQYMADVASALIEQEKTPELPIFGINEDSVHIYPYVGTGVQLAGAFGGLSESILPQTPAEMHYVVSITQEDRIVQSCSYYFVSTGSFAGTIERHRIYWKANLIDVQTGKTYRTREIAGPAPVACPYSTYTMFDIWGAAPDRADLEAWLKTFVK